MVHVTHALGHANWPPLPAMQATDTAEFLASMMDEQQSSEPWFGAIQSLWCWKHINENFMAKIEMP